MSLALKEAERIVGELVKKERPIIEIAKKVADEKIKQGDYVPNTCTSGLSFFNGLGPPVLVAFPLKERLNLSIIANYKKITAILSQYHLRIRGRDIVVDEGETSKKYFGFFGANYRVGTFIAVNPFFAKAGEILEKIGELYGMKTK